MLEKFKAQPATLVVPEIDGQFCEAVLDLSFLSVERKSRFDLKKNEDARGSFTELLKTESCGQFSVNISKPGITKGQHWHNTKLKNFSLWWRGMGRFRSAASAVRTLEFNLATAKPLAIHMLPGTPIISSKLQARTENLVTLMTKMNRLTHRDRIRFEKV